MGDIYSQDIVKALFFTERLSDSVSDVPFFPVPVHLLPPQPRKTEPGPKDV